MFQGNGAAAVGKYEGGGAGAAGGDSLFVANHAYWALPLFTYHENPLSSFGLCYEFRDHTVMDYYIVKCY